MARHRKTKNKTLPPNLYEGINGHYKYRRPDTGKWHSLGTDRNKAVSAAKQLNSMLMDGRDLIEKVMGNSSLFNLFLDKFELTILPERRLAKKTITDYKNKLVHVRKKFGEKPIDEISVIDIAEFLDSYPAIQSNRYRSLLVIIFKYAVAKGLIKENPAEKTIPRMESKARSRLSVEGYFAIYDKAEPWLKNAMDLALQTLQREEDIVKMKFADIRDNCLYVIQEKTKKHGESAYIKIKIEKPLQNIIDRCRDSLLSPYLIHRKPEIKNRQNLQAKSKAHYTQVTAEYLSKAFSNIRDQLDIFQKIPVAERPTFHEIRSLGIKQYEDQGHDAQALAGHTNREMTDKYKEGHEIKWTEATAGLQLKRQNK